MNKQLYLKDGIVTFDASGEHVGELERYSESDSSFTLKNEWPFFALSKEVIDYVLYGGV